MTVLPTAQIFYYLNQTPNSSGLNFDIAIAELLDANGREVKSLNTP